MPIYTNNPPYPTSTKAIGLQHAFVAGLLGHSNGRNGAGTRWPANRWNSKYTNTRFGGRCLFDGMATKVPSSGTLDLKDAAFSMAWSEVPPRRHALPLDFPLGP